MGRDIEGDRYICSQDNLYMVNGSGVENIALGTVKTSRQVMFQALHENIDFRSILLGFIQIERNLSI